jgi:hypothetical protein
MPAKRQSKNSNQRGRDGWAKNLTDLVERASKRIFGLPISPGQKFASVMFFAMLGVQGIFAWKSSHSPGCVLAGMLCLMVFAVWIISDVRRV